MRPHAIPQYLALVIGLAIVPACAVGDQDAGWSGDVEGLGPEAGAGGGAGFGGSSGGAGVSVGAAGEGGSAGVGGKGGSAGAAGKGGSAGAAGKGGSPGTAGSSGAAGAGGGAAGAGPGGMGGGGGSSSSACSDASLICQQLGAVGTYCAGANASPPASAADCTNGPQACPSGYDCLTNSGVGYCLEPCDLNGTGGGAGSGSSDCSLVKNPSQSCCVDDVRALDCMYGDTPIDCSMFGQMCGWDSMLGYYTCVDAPAQSAPSSAEPRICGS